MYESHSLRLNQSFPTCLLIQLALMYKVCAELLPHYIKDYTI